MYVMICKRLFESIELLRCKENIELKFSDLINSMENIFLKPISPSSLLFFRKLPCRRMMIKSMKEIQKAATETNSTHINSSLLLQSDQ